MEPLTTQGLHHVTMVSANAQRTLSFYRDVLGLGLVKRTVNFDDPGSYHFYFGDEAGSPGSILTFFPWPGLQAGRQGAGMVLGNAVCCQCIRKARIGNRVQRIVVALPDFGDRVLLLGIKRIVDRRFDRLVMRRQRRILEAGRREY